VFTLKKDSLPMNTDFQNGKGTDRGSTNQNQARIEENVHIDQTQSEVPLRIAVSNIGSSKPGGSKKGETPDNKNDSS
jgi:hypothetical protein